MCRDYIPGSLQGHEIVHAITKAMDQCKAMVPGSSPGRGADEKILILSGFFLGRQMDFGTKNEFLGSSSKRSPSNLLSSLIFYRYHGKSISQIQPLGYLLNRSAQLPKASRKAMGLSLVKTA